MVASVSLMSGQPASAAGGGCLETPSLGSVICGGDTGSSTPGDAPGGGSSSSGGSTGHVYRPINNVSSDPNGQPCLATNYIEVPPGSPELPANIGGDAGNVLNPPPPCPAAAGAPARSPAQIAASYWEEVPLPHPGPYIAPGWAISGKLAYLETRGETTHSYFHDTPLGQMTIVATGTYEVDWGDGTGTDTSATEGAPWPGGTINHDYQWAGTYDVVVTEHWTATWHLGGESGNLRRLRTEGRIDDFEVRQIQAVRVR